MPADRSSLIPAATDPDHARPLVVGDCAGLLERLAMLPDPRDRRGRRHTLASVLAVSAAAVVAGARSVTAIAEWATDAPWPILAALGVRGDPLTRRCQVPGEATIRRVLARVDGAAVDTTVGAWLADRLRPPPRPRRVIAVDGKSLRGSACDGRQVHLLAALDQHDGAVLAQRQVDGAPAEVPAFQPLLTGLDLAGVVVTADALDTQRDHAAFLVDRGAEDLLVVKANQPTLHAQLAELPWRQIPVMDRTRDHGHGRVEIRTLNVAAVAGLYLPTPPRRSRSAAASARRAAAAGAPSPSTPSPAWPWAPPAPPSWPAGYAGTGGSRTGCTPVRDVDFGQDASTARAGSLPRVMASLGNLAIGALRLPATPTSPPRCDIPAATLPGRLPFSTWHTDETDITAL